MKSRFFESTLFFTLLIIMLMVPVIAADATHEREDIVDPKTKSQIDSITNDFSSTNNPEHQKSLQSKLEILQYQISIKAEAHNISHQKPTDICMTIPKNLTFVETRATGILPGSPGPFSSQILRVENQWQELINDYWFHLYAGSSGLDPKKGGVILWIEDVDSGGFFEDPNPEGPLTIVNSHGTRLELITPTGNLRYFDILSQQFIADLEVDLKEVNLPPPILFDPCTND